MMITELKGYANATHLAFTKVTALILVLAILCAGTAFAASPSYYVDIYDGNEITRVQTSKNDAAAIVEQAGVKLGEQDKLNTAEFTVGANSFLTIYRAAAISFTDLEGNVSYMVFAGTVADLLDSLGVTLSEDVLVSHATDVVLQDGMEIKLIEAYHLNVTADGVTTPIAMGEGTVRDALTKAGVTLGEDDETEPALDEQVTEGTEIAVYRVEYTVRTVTEAVAFEKKTEKDDGMFRDQRIVKQKGVNGTRKVTYRDKIVDGKYASSEETASTTLTESVPQVSVVGTKKRPPAVKLKSGAPISELTEPDSLKIENGAPTEYKNIIRGKAAAYTAPKGAKTASGRAVKPGYIAVNPNQIPYGSELWIVSTDGIVYGYAIAADTGGFVNRGKFTVDLFMNTKSQCKQWGARDVIIYVL